MILAVVLMSTACEKDDPIIDEPEQTLEEMYPEWSNLSWVSTDGNADASDEDNYPRLEITIVGDVVSVHQPIDADGHALNGWYSEVIINGNTITFSDDVITDDYNEPDITGTFSKSGGQITFITKALTTTEHTYVLQ